VDAASRMDLRGIASFLAVLTPVAIALGNVASETVVACVAVLFLTESLMTRDFAWARQPWFAVALGLWAYSVVRSLFPIVTPAGLGIGFGWVRFILFAAALATWVLPDERNRRRLAMAGIAAVTFMAADSLLQFAIGFDIIGRPVTGGHRLTAEFPRPMIGVTIAWTFFPLLMGLIQDRRRWLAIGFAALSAMAVFLSGERWAFLIVVAALMSLLLYLPQVRRTARWLLPAAAVVLLGSYVVAPRIMHRQVGSTIDTVRDFATSHYGIIWSSAWRIAEDHPLFGDGVRAYRVACLDPRYGPELIGPKQYPRCEPHPHNNYLEWLVDTGLLGLFGFVVMAAQILLRVTRGLAANPRNLVLYGLLVTLVARFWPLTSTTSFFIAWSAVPLWLAIGWGLALAARPTER